MTPASSGDHRVERLHHAQITVPKGAEDDARDFYCGLLGLREVPKPENLKKRGGFWIQLDNAQVHVGVEDGVERAATKAHVAYEVDDLESWRRTLTERGVAIVDGEQIPDHRRFEFRDPFGNRVELLQPTG